MDAIIGVDFSGHRDDCNTWMAWGHLTQEGALVIDSVQPARRDDLYEFLGHIATPAVAASGRATSNIYSMSGSTKTTGRRPSTAI